MGKVLPAAALYQTARRFNGGLGVDYDSNHIRTDDIGQWGYAGVGGSTWTAQTAPATSTLDAVASVDANRAWAVGEGGMVARTTDAGSTWTTGSVPTTATLRGVAFVDPNSGWAVGDAGTALRTTDGGSTWTAGSTPGSSTLNSVAFTDASTGWAVGEAGAVLRTSNAGSNWVTATTPATETLNSVAFADARSGWAVGGAGAMIRTTDRGVTWTRASAPATATLNSVAFADAKTGCAVGEAGTIMRTTNGGSTWALCSSTTTATLRSVAFADAKIGWAVGDAGTVVRTADGGATWALTWTPAIGRLNSAAFVDGNTGWAVGEGGTIIHARKNGTEQLGSVAGAVTDAISGQPVSGVSIQIGSRPAIPTAVDGSFVTVRVPPGTYTVTITSPRYITSAVTGVVVSAGVRASVRLRPTPRTATSVTPPALSSQIPTRSVVFSLTAALKPASAASSTVSTLYLSHYEQKWAFKKVKGKRKKVKVWYWRQRAAYRMTADASGGLSLQTSLAAGRWRAYVICSGAATYLPSTSATIGFSVR
jgi:photosystem II stability/assembly factor-like uncharacterized protein